MNRSFMLMAAVGLASLLAGAFLFKLVEPESATIDSGREIALHAIPLSGLDGRQTRLDDWHSELLVVNFWAPWCAPCRREIPALIEIQQAYPVEQVRILGIAFDGEQQVRRFAAEYAIDYPLFLTGNRGAMYNAAFDNPSGSLPYTVLLGPDRNILFQHNGELRGAQLREQLDARL